MRTMTAPLMMSMDATRPAPAAGVGVGVGVDIAGETLMAGAKHSASPHRRHPCRGAPGLLLGRERVLDLDQQSEGGQFGSCQGASISLYARKPPRLFARRFGRFAPR